MNSFLKYVSESPADEPEEKSLIQHQNHQLVSFNAPIAHGGDPSENFIHHLILWNVVAADYWNFTKDDLDTFLNSATSANEYFRRDNPYPHCFLLHLKLQTFHNSSYMSVRAFRPEIKKFAYPSSMKRWEGKFNFPERPDCRFDSQKPTVCKSREELWILSDRKNFRA
ncbi:hypothetical protein WA026_023156 [Henosepilachna vigintioctopunctata]|uniref:Uncharacterized protein n=1 Tax=Henosepilachna vigintioctopunctata TaxID=420089 RepID=A0AAW1U2H7_9CUCU